MPLNDLIDVRHLPLRNIVTLLLVLICDDWRGSQIRIDQTIAFHFIVAHAVTFSSLLILTCLLSLDFNWVESRQLKIFSSVSKHS